MNNLLPLIVGFPFLVAGVFPFLSKAEDASTQKGLHRIALGASVVLLLLTGLLALSPEAQTATFNFCHSRNICNLFDERKQLCLFFTFFPDVLF